MTSQYNDKDSADAEASLPPPMTADSYDSDSRKRSADEADLPPDSSEDHKKMQARREANRVHALKSRQRSKLLFTDLQATVQQLSRDKSELERHNAVLNAQVEVLQQQNFTLMQNQQQMLLQQQKQQQPVSVPQQPAAPNAATAATFPFTAAAATNPFLVSSGTGSPFMNPSLTTMMEGMMGYAAVNPVMLQNMQALGAMHSGNNFAAAVAALRASTNNNQSSTTLAGTQAVLETTNSNTNPLSFVTSSSPLPQASTPNMSFLTQLASQAQEAAGLQHQHSQSRNQAWCMMISNVSGLYSLRSRIYF